MPEASVDYAWLMLTAALVMIMQVGFLLLEAGMVRSKNAINVAQKNLLDFIFGILGFALVGFMVAFGPASPLKIGIGSDFFILTNLTDWEKGFFVFQVMFCGTSATIVSGAVAERMKLMAYVVSSFLMSSLIYPVFASWVWGAQLGPNSNAWLHNLGFVDFAGSTVVHATGGWISLAACLVIGPRIGRYDASGKPVRFIGHNPVLATAGAMLLFFGWIGFNGGSTLKAGPETASIILNTVLAGGIGGCFGYLLGLRKDGILHPERPYTAMLGGLVAVTAGCEVLTPAGAMIIGAIGGCVALYAMDFIDSVLKIDDAVGAIAVHGFGGVTGTLGLALLAPVENLPAGSHLAQLGIQATGSVVNFLWTFGLGYGMFWLLNRVTAIRIKPEEELIGLNVAEHDTRIGIGHVEEAFADLLSGRVDKANRLPTDPGGEAEKLTGMFNVLMDRLEEQEDVRAEIEGLQRNQQEQERISALANATFEAILIHRDGVILDANEQLADLFGTSVQALVNAHVIDLVVAEQQAHVLEMIRQQPDYSTEILVTTMAGIIVPVEVRSRDIYYQGSSARVVCLIDLRERKEAEQRIRHVALHDPLTGLPNRSLFNDELERRIDMSARGGSSALVLVDIDRFKEINDIHGHQAGDAVIEEVARRLSLLAGKHNFAARLGGDEFAIVLANIAFDSQIKDFGRHILDAVERPVEIPDGKSIVCTVSIGAARCPDHAQNSEDLFAVADIALYESKNGGRNRCTIFEDGMNELIQKRRDLETDLRGAIHHREFELYLQPRVAVHSCEIESYEALLRWHRGGRETVSPADFIPVAEASGLIVPIGQWVIDEACRLISQGVEGKQISINISPQQFHSEGFVEGLVSAVTAYHVPTGQLELEITESILIDNNAKARHILTELKSLGFGIALDDFGTGYSSLSYLSRYPFDTVKIDRSFVGDLGRSDSAPVIIRSIVALGRGLGMKVVAEGVETIEEARFLMDSGCDELQGFLLGRPVPYDERLKAVEPQMAQELINISADAQTVLLRPKARFAVGAGRIAEM